MYKGLNPLLFVYLGEADTTGSTTGYPIAWYALREQVVVFFSKNQAEIYAGVRNFVL